MLRGERDKVGRDDMVTLSQITEEELMDNLKKRYLAVYFFFSFPSILALTV